MWRVTLYLTKLYIITDAIQDTKIMCRILYSSVICYIYYTILLSFTNFAVYTCVYVYYGRLWMVYRELIYIY